MKNIRNKTYVILAAICLLMTALSSALMSLSSGTAMSAYGVLTLVVGAICTWAASRLLRPERAAE